jgi:hypothetical protein
MMMRMREMMRRMEGEDLKATLPYVPTSKSNC